MHRPIDCDNPGGDLYLMAYATPAEAEAYTHGLELCCCVDDTGWLVRTFADNLTCVLVDCRDSTRSALHLEDMRVGRAACRSHDQSRVGTTT